MHAIKIPLILNPCAFSVGVYERYCKEKAFENYIFDCIEMISMVFAI